MSDLFLNYDPSYSAEIRTYRRPNCVSGELVDVLTAMSREEGPICVSIDSMDELREFSDALEDGAYLQHIECKQECVEELHTIINEYLDKYGDES